MRTVLERPAFASPHVVFDANKLRDHVAVSARLADYLATGNAIVVPTEFFQEIARSKRPESTLRASLAALAQCPEAVLVAHRAAHVSTYEVTTRAPATTILWEEQTGELRQLLEDLRDGRANELAIQGTLARAHRSRVTSGFGARKRELGPYVGFWKRTIPHGHWSRFVAAYRKKNAALVPALMAEVLSVAIIHDIFTRKWNQEIADALALQPSSTALWNVLLIRLALDWALRGGFQSADTRRVGRDVGDLDYAWVALHCEELVTKDAGARTQFEDAKSIARTLWPSEAARFPATPQ